MTCEECKASRVPETIPYVAHEAEMARAERTQKRLWVIILLVIIFLVGSNCAWLYYESQFEDVVQTIEADQDGSGPNVVGGGDVTYGAEG